MKNLCSKLIKKIKNKLDPDPYTPSLRREVKHITRLTGASGAAEAFAHYAMHQAELAEDKKLYEFMSFYERHWKESASQWSQDIFALYANKSKEGGLFLEIGGANGYLHSNTYMLETIKNWSGTLIEPDSSQFDYLKIVRKNCKNINAAISPQEEEGYSTLRKVGQLSALTGYEGKDMHENTRLSSKSFSKVRTISLTTILKQNKFDYFSLDVEGAELKILSNLDWTSIIKPSSITVEHNFRKSDRLSLLAILESQGYKEIFAEHDWLRRGDIWATLAE